jgi:curli production assembly/transport component CsgF
MKTVLFGAFCLAAAASPAAATEIVYTPVNPAFGGSPLNGPHLLNSAQAQNTLTDPNTASRGTPLEQFNQRLQSVILSRIASSVSGSIVDASGNLQTGNIETTDFLIQVADAVLPDGLPGLRITTTDKATGASTSFTVGSGSP